MRESIIDIEARSHDKVLAGCIHGILHTVAQQAGTVFQTAAKCALSGVRRQQFAVQVAVAALDVYTVKTCTLGQFCSLGKLFFQGKQVLIGQDTVG